ncbi:unnamed protein product [Effrenium voratum]|uniref:RING-type domain-containing protein n=1 Tax=Effrenium voratum TaxID=2562239 RepID=A0AA36J1Y2_9DINO|nr:unnamed protein product [Effrenium voratum]
MSAGAVDEWLQQYVEKHRRLPATPDQLCSFARNHGHALRYSAAKMAMEASSSRASLLEPLLAEHLHAASPSASTSSTSSPARAPPPSPQPAHPARPAQAQAQPRQMDGQSWLQLFIDTYGHRPAASQLSHFVRNRGGTLTYMQCQHLIDPPIRRHAGTPGAPSQRTDLARLSLLSSALSSVLSRPERWQDAMEINRHYRRLTRMIFTTLALDEEVPSLDTQLPPQICRDLENRLMQAWEVEETSETTPEWVQLPCQHTLHRACYGQLVRHNALQCRCPLCRSGPVELAAICDGLGIPLLGRSIPRGEAVPSVSEGGWLIGPRANPQGGRYTIDIEKEVDKLIEDPSRARRKAKGKDVRREAPRRLSFLQEPTQSSSEKGAISAGLAAYRAQGLATLQAIEMQADKCLAPDAWRESYDAGLSAYRAQGLATLQAMEATSFDGWYAPGPGAPSPAGDSGTRDELGAAVLPDKNDDPWTTSSQFKLDLVELFGNSSDQVVLEVGAHLGFCTRVLARLFGTVLALENSAPVLRRNARRNADLRNVVYLKFHSVMDDWTTFSQTPIHAVFIDAAHDYGSVKSDLERALALPGVHTIVLDDYGTRTGVHQAVSEVVASGGARIKRFVGREPPWSYGDVQVPDWEGVALEPLAQPSAASPPLDLAASLLGTSWVVFPAGVFSSGYFMPHGQFQLDRPHQAASSYGPMEWRAALPGEIEGAVPTLILQVVEEPHWRLQAEVTEQRTGMALRRNDGVVFVAVRQDMMRVIGDKLLSFLH